MHCKLVLRSNTLNIGDLNASPASYFDLGNCSSYDILAPRLATKLQDADLIIVGSGGLLFFDQVVAQLCNFRTIRSFTAPLVFWGIGCNKHDKLTDRFPSWLSKADLIGVRDVVPEYSWTPCVSCMSPAFATKRQASHKFVIYDHIDRRVPFKDVERRNNESFKTIGAALDWIGSGEIVLTTSYHGVYWATLLGRRVIVWPWSSKFMHFKHPPIYGCNTPIAPVCLSQRDLDKLADKATAYPDALEECRQATNQFYNKVSTLQGVS